MRSFSGLDESAFQSVESFSPLMYTNNCQLLVTLSLYHDIKNRIVRLDHSRDLSRMCSSPSAVCVD